MKYVLLIGGAEDGWDHLDDAGQRALYARITTWWDERKASGELLEGAQLQPSTTATTVRRAISGDVTVTDGPFVEGKEMIGGYGVIEVADLDAALAGRRGAAQPRGVADDHRASASDRPAAARRQVPPATGAAWRGG